MSGSSMSMVSIPALLPHTRENGCMETHRLLLLGYLSLSAAQPTRAQSAATSASLSPASAPPVTVADLIGMTLFGSDPHNGGRQDDALKPSADGAHDAAVTERGVA